jgi:hypothetical protein
MPRSLCPVFFPLFIIRSNDPYFNVSLFLHSIFLKSRKCSNHQTQPCMWDETWREYNETTYEKSTGKKQICMKMQFLSYCTYNAHCHRCCTDKFSDESRAEKKIIIINKKEINHMCEQNRDLYREELWDINRKISSIEETLRYVQIQREQRSCLSTVHTFEKNEGKKK